MNCVGTWNDNTVASLVSTVDPVMPVIKVTRWIAKEKQKKTERSIFYCIPVQPFYGRSRPHGPKHQKLQNGSPFKKVVVACFCVYC